MEPNGTSRSETIGGNKVLQSECTSVRLPSTVGWGFSADVNSNNRTRRHAPRSKMLSRGVARARTARGQQDLSAALELEAEWKGFLSAIVARWDGNGSVRKQDRSRRREQEIMRAALRVFARDGLSRSRIQDVAAEAGMPVSTLYEYCASKEELAYLIPMASLSKFYSEYAEAVQAETTARGRLRLYLCMAGDFARRNPEWARVLYLEIWPSGLIGEAPLRRCLDDYVRRLLFLVRQGERLRQWESGANPYRT